MIDFEIIRCPYYVKSKPCRSLMDYLGEEVTLVGYYLEWIIILVRKLLGVQNVSVYLAELGNGNN